MIVLLVIAILIVIMAVAAVLIYYIAEWAEIKRLETEFRIQAEKEREEIRKMREAAKEFQDIMKGDDQ